MRDAKIAPGIWAGQSLHFVCLAVLLVLSWTAWRFLGRPIPAAFWMATAIPVVHQLFVWLAWRLELRSSATSGLLGFQGYLGVFFLLFGSRFISLVVLAWIDRGSLRLPLLLQFFLSAPLVLLGGYALYSVQRYFGMQRAAGADHFDPRFRDLPLVKEGIFRFTRNGMYVFAFLLFWAIAIGFGSAAALCVAAFSHAYIWVHYIATEKPDMDYLYGNDL